MKILIIDDDRAVCSSLSLLFKKKGYQTKAISHPNVALEVIQNMSPDIIILDMNFTIDTSGKQGLRLLKRIMEFDPQMPVILMTGWATVQLAVEGMKIGAKDFLAKPWDNQHLLSSVETILSLSQRKSTSQDTNSDEESAYSIIGESDELKAVMDMVERVAPTSASVLITGESGTGKELVAEAIHQKSKRADQAFVKVNLGGIPTNLFESEMFGHKRGAFTGANEDRVGRFAKANGGSIFLDEIGELNLANQVKMLRVLQERTFEVLGSSEVNRSDVRVISATNKDLPFLVNEGIFREDLFYRINLISIHLPSLKERRIDIPLLVKHFARNIASLYDAEVPYMDKETMDWLSMQNYPGNIRQLKNIVERTLLMNLGKKDLSWKAFQPSFMLGRSVASANSTDDLNLEKQEIYMIERALNHHNHSISAAARALGITRSSLYRRLEKFGIPHEPKI